MKNIYRLLVIFTFLPMVICAQVDTINSDQAEHTLDNQSGSSEIYCSIYKILPGEVAS